MTHLPRLSAEGAEKSWSTRATDPDQLIALDLFSGAGGLSLGFANAGFFVAAAMDHNETAVETHAANFLSKSVCIDLTGIDTDGARALVLEELGLPRVDVIIGGPPCQGFAAVGRVKVKSLPSHQRERLAKRNDLYKEFLKFVEALKPPCVVMENVPHLASFQDGQVADTIRDDFDRLGYDIGTVEQRGKPLLLEAADFGVPQTRRRLFFLGFRRGRTAPVYSPRPTHALELATNRLAEGDTPINLRKTQTRLSSLFLQPPRTLADAISDLPALCAPSYEFDMRYEAVERTDLEERHVITDLSYRELMRSAMPDESRDRLYDHIVRGVREDDAAAFLHMEEGGTYADVPAEYRRYAYAIDHFEDRYYRLAWGRPSRTITAHIAKDGYWYIHPDKSQSRTLSVREAARVQSFPDNFRFCGFRTNMFVQIGNAVPPLLGEAIANRIRESIERGAGETWSPTPTPPQMQLSR